MRRTSLALVSAVCLTCACGGTSPSAPSPTPDLTGTWRGNFAVQGTTSLMTWTLVQTGTAVTGPVLVTLENGIVLMNGFLTGTVTGSSLAYSIAIGPGGIPSQPACAGQLGGTMTATTSSTLAGNYAVASSTCTPPIASTGNITLTR